MSKTLAGAPQARSVADIATIARELFAGVEGAIKHKQQLRPYICPFHILVDHVPAGASILDVGCGAGLFILLLARMGRLRSAFGFDSDAPAIDAANTIAAGLPGAAALRFEHRTAHAQWPEGSFDVVSIIDVLHHVPPDKQANVIATAASRVIVAKGKQVAEFETGGKAAKEVVDAMLGPTGNLRAPVVRSGKTVLVGFNDDVWAKALA